MMPRRAASKAKNRTKELPPELRRNLPQIAQEIADRRVIVLIFVVSYVCTGYILSHVGSGWARLISPVIGALVSALFVTWKRIEPYQIHEKWRTGITRAEIESDPAARWLRQTLRSREAGHLPWKRMPLSLAASYVLVLFWWWIRPTQSWRVDYAEIIRAAGLWSVPGFLIYIQAQWYWALKGSPGSSKSETGRYQGIKVIRN
jgi:hypothetical protein